MNMLDGEQLKFTELTPLSDVELSEKEQEEILSSYDQERRISSKSCSPTEGKVLIKDCNIFCCENIYFIL